MARQLTMGQKLKELRTAADMTQLELAKAARVGLGTIRNWEQDRRMPLLSIAAHVADALGVSLDEMVERRHVGRPRKATPATPPAEDSETTTKKTRGRPRKGK